MKILVTGGAGYIGSTLTPFLLAAGHNVRVLDHLAYGGQSFLAYGQIQALNSFAAISVIARSCGRRSQIATQWFTWQQSWRPRLFSRARLSSFHQP
jgi:nucleoside-diphosphate-sugar epimerase